MALQTIFEMLIFRRFSGAKTKFWDYREEVIISEVWSFIRFRWLHMYDGDICKIWRPTACFTFATPVRKEKSLQTTRRPMARGLRPTADGSRPIVRSPWHAAYGREPRRVKSQNKLLRVIFHRRRGHRFCRTNTGGVDRFSQRELRGRTDSVVRTGGVDIVCQPPSFWYKIFNRGTFKEEKITY